MIFFFRGHYIFLSPRPAMIQGVGEETEKDKEKNKHHAARAHTHRNSLREGEGGGGGNQLLYVTRPPVSTQPPPPSLLHPQITPGALFVLACLHTVLVKRSTPLPTKARLEWRGWAECVHHPRGGKTHAQHAQQHSPSQLLRLHPHPLPTIPPQPIPPQPIPPPHTH